MSSNASTDKLYIVEIVKRQSHLNREKTVSYRLQNPREEDIVKFVRSLSKLNSPVKITLGEEDVTARILQGM